VVKGADVLGNGLIIADIFQLVSIPSFSFFLVAKSKFVIALVSFDFTAELSVGIEATFFAPTGTTGLSVIFQVIELQLRTGHLLIFHHIIERTASHSSDWPITLVQSKNRDGREEELSFSAWREIEGL
jgi:hypothetical protein